MEGRRKVARAVQESGGSFLSVGRPLSLSWRPTMSPWQRARREGGRYFYSPAAPHFMAGGCAGSFGLLPP